MLNTYGGMQVPYENYRKIFRTSQRHVERELGAVLTTSNELANWATSGTLDTDDVLKSMDNMIGRVENLKRKVNSTHPYIGYFSPLKFSFPICMREMESQPKMSCASVFTIWLPSSRYRVPINPSSRDGLMFGLIGG